MTDQQTPKMESPLKARIYQWLASFGLGSLPLIVHLTIYFLVTSPKGWAHNWTGDIIFINISVSTVTTLSLIATYYKTSGKLQLPPRVFLFIAILLLCLVISAVIYALSATGIADSNAIYWAIVLLVAIIGPSFILEFDIARKDLEISTQSTGARQ